MTTNTVPVHHRSPVAAKIALFRSLFRGREDVYPRRFESRKTGRCGYQPACANEWARGLCEKPKVKCSACPHRRFLPVTDDVIRRHLSGQDADGRPFVMGVYPMLQDETCFLPGGRFRQDDIGKKTLKLLRELVGDGNLPIVMERSRSGNGAHAWLFFAEAIPAVLARKLGSHILTETMEQRPDIGLDSYDRLFPNQDTLAPGRFRQSDCVAASKTTARTRQQRLYTQAGRTMAAVSRPMGVSFDRSEDGSQRRGSDRA